MCIELTGIQSHPPNLILNAIMLQIKANLLAEYSSRYSKYESGELLSPSGGASMPESLSENTY